MNRFLAEFKKFYLVEKIVLMLIYLFVIKIIYYDFTVRYYEFPDDPFQKKGIFILAFVWFCLCLVATFIPYYFQTKSPEMQWLKNSDDPKANLFVSKMVSTIALIVGCSLLFGIIFSHK